MHASEPGPATNKTNGEPTPGDAKDLSRMSSDELKAEMIRMYEEEEAKAKALWKASGPWFMPTAVGITVLSIAVPGVFIGVHADEPVLWFKSFALSAAVLGAVAGGIRLWAHNGSKNLDGFGKMLGFSAATLSAYAAGSLFFIDLTQLNP